MFFRLPLISKSPLIFAFDRPLYQIIFWISSR
jgi:hypothetical protein